MNTENPNFEEKPENFTEEQLECEEDILNEVGNDLKTLKSKQKTQPKKLNKKDLVKFGTCLGRILGVARARSFLNRLFSKGMSPVRKKIEEFIKSSGLAKSAKNYSEMLQKLKKKTDSKSKSQLLRISGALSDANWARFIIHISTNNISLSSTVSEKLLDGDYSLENTLSGSVRGPEEEKNQFDEYKNNLNENLSELINAIKQAATITEKKLRGGKN